MGTARKDPRGLFLPRFHRIPRLPSHVFPEERKFLDARRVQRSCRNRGGDIFPGTDLFDTDPHALLTCFAKQSATAIACRRRQFATMAPVVGLLLLCALSAGLQPTTAAGTRKLQQSNGPANTYGNAASATTSDLVNDPAGRAHLLVSAHSSAAPRRRLGCSVPKACVINSSLVEYCPAPVCSCTTLLTLSTTYDHVHNGVVLARCGLRTTRVYCRLDWATL